MFFVNDSGQLFRLFLALFLFFALSLSLLAQQTDLSSAASVQQEVRKLEQRQTIKRALGDQEKHLYRVSLQAGEFFQVRVDQQGVDVIVELLDSSGRLLAEMDSPNGTEGFEVLSWIVEKSGEYMVRTSGVTEGAAKGDYVIVWQGKRQATEKDRRRIEIESIFRDAMGARNSKDEVGRQAALPKFEAALRGWEELKDGYLAGLTYAEVSRLKGPAPLPGNNGGPKTFSSERNINGRAIKVPLKYGERLSFPVLLKKSEVLRLDVEEHSVNVVLVVAKMETPSKGNVLAQSHYGQGHQRETLTFIAEEEGEYLIVVEPEAEFSVGKDAWVRLFPVIHNVTSENDRQRVAVERLMFEFHKLTSRGFTDQLTSALTKLEQAAPLWREAGDVYWEGYTLAQIGEIYKELDEPDKALDYFARALRLFRAAKDKSGEAGVMGNLGRLYSYLGDSVTALDYYQKEVALWKEVGNKRGEAATLNQVCDFDRLFGSFEQQLDCHMRSLLLYREDENERGEAMMHNNIGLFYFQSNKYKEAKEHYDKALALYEKDGATQSVALVLANISYVYAYQGEKEKAIEPTLQILGHSIQRGDANAVASTYATLSQLWGSLGNPSLAIFYGKQAVNTYQELRRQILKVDKQLQKSFLRKVEDEYRQLSAKLIAQGRLEEAQQVLEFFKDQQFFDFEDDNRKLSSQPIRKLALTDGEKAAAQTLEGIQKKVRATGKPYLELRADAEVSTEETKISPEEEIRLGQLEQQASEALQEYRSAHNQIEKDFNPGVLKNNRVDNITETLTLRDTLRTLSLQTEQKVVAVYTIVSGESFHALIVTPDSISSASYPIKAATLNEKALQLWSLLQSDTYDPTILSQELYSIVFKSIEEKLPQDTKTILWSLDGNLRYIPMGVLHDGKQYLIERYNHVVFTRADRERLTRMVSPRWTGVGLGSSRAQTVELLGNRVSFDALPGVEEELRSVFRLGGDSNGIIDGEVLPDDSFTKTAMLTALERRRPLVHIASHFSFRPGDEARSFLLLGNGGVMTMAEMKSQKDLFAGVELLTLSACNTAAQQPDANGREIDAFAELAQRLGAGSVMATLWAVADNSTPWLMREFYRSRQNAIDSTKAEALRKAQLALLNGSAKISPLPEIQKRSLETPDLVITANDGKRNDNSTRADIVYITEKDAPPYRRNPNKPFAHPYYWAPFILIGNLR